MPLHFIFQLAGVTIQVEHRYPDVYDLCKEFVVSGDGLQPDFTVSSTEDEIQKEFKAYEHIYHRPLDFEDWKGLCESNSLITAICAKMPFYNAFMLHAAAIAVDGVAYIFTAPSGTGKTTHILLWKEHFGERAVIVNGDKLLLRFLDGKVYVCSTPWKGKENFGLGPGVMLPVGGICIIEQSPSNHIRPLSPSQAAVYLLRHKQIFIPRYNEAYFQQFWALFQQVISATNFYLLQCNREPIASRLSYLTMKRNWEEQGNFLVSEQ